LRDATIARCQPLFDAMGQQTFVISAKPSEANLAKLTGNFLIASMLESLGEAFALVRKSGLDPHRYLNILTSTLFSAPVYRTYGSRSATAAAISLSAAVHSASRRITTPSTGTGARMHAAFIASVGLNEPYRDSSEPARMDVALAADRGRVAELLGHTLDRARD
jgi:hypothetical protein